MAFYADDAILMTRRGNGCGKDALRDAMKQMLTDPAVSLTFQSRKWTWPSPVISPTPQGHTN